jgi:DNA-binding transcriptional MerR regulator
MSPGSSLTIGELAGSTGVAVETIRYYERIGLLPAPARTAAGYRLYGDDDVQRLLFVRRTRDLGLHLDAVRELLGLAGDRLRPCARVDRLVRDHIHELDHKIAGLVGLRRELQRIADSCQGGKIDECRILQSFAHEDPPVPRADADCDDDACTMRKPARPRARRVAHD